MFDRFLKPIIIFACFFLIIGFTSFLKILLLPSANNQVIDKEYPLGSIHSIDVDDSGNIYCANSYYGSVQVYDNNGQFLYTLRIYAGNGGFRIKVINNKLFVATVRNQKLYTFLSGKLIDEKTDTDKYFTFLAESKKQIYDSQGNKYKISPLQFIYPKITMQKLNSEKVTIINSSCLEWLFMAPLPAMLFIILGISLIFSQIKRKRKNT